MLQHFSVVRLALLLLAVVALSSVKTQDTESKAPEKLKVSIYYEVLCSDSVYFLQNQLYPSWSKRKSIMDLTMIPYGKAFQWRNEDTPNKWEFHCQHGPDECYGNKLHACALDQLKFNDAMLLIACTMRRQRRNFNWCGSFYGIDVSKIETCANSDKGSELLAFYGNKTNTEIDLTFVPTISLDEKQIAGLFYNFDGDFCKDYNKKYPEEPKCV